MKAFLARIVRFVIGPPAPPRPLREAPATDDEFDVRVYLYAPLSVPQLF